MIALALLLPFMAPAIQQEGFDLEAFAAHPVVQDFAAGKDLHAMELLFMDLDEDVYRSRIYLTDEESWTPLSKGRHDESHPRWSPDGKTLAYLKESRQGKGRMEITIQEPDGEAVSPFDWRGDVSEFAWSPDGSRIAFTGSSSRERRLAREQETEPLEINRLNWFADGEGPDLGLRTHLFVGDLDTGEVLQITSGDFDDSEPAWSPDGASIAFVSSREAHRFDTYDSDVFVIPSVGGEARLLTSERTTQTTPVWSPDGSWIAFAGTTQIDRDGSVIHLWLMRPDGSDQRNLTKSVDRSLAVDDGSGRPIWLDDETLLCGLEDGGGTRVLSVQTDGKIQSWPTPPGVLHYLQDNPEGNLAAVWEETGSAPRWIELQIGEDGPFLSKRGSQSAEWSPVTSFSSAQVFLTKSFDGLEIEAWFLPAAESAEESRGTILHVHGGPNARFDEGFEAEHQLWAANGYSVLYANPRGSTGYGQSFADRVAGRYGLEDYQDLMSVVDRAIQEGWVDPERLYLTGYSYGGMMSNWAVTQTKRFRAVVSGAGLSNYLACYGVDDSLITWDQEMGPPFENLEPYIELSPVTHIEKVETPILLLHGAEDVRCPASQSMHFYTLLKRRGVDTRLVLYPEESHDLGTYPSHWLDYQERLLDWFAAH